MSQKFSIKCLQASNCPQEAAACNGVQPSLSAEFTSHPICSNILKGVKFLFKALELTYALHFWLRMISRKEKDVQNVSERVEKGIFKNHF